MDGKDRKALDSCFQEFLLDLSPDDAFLEKLCIRRVLTTEQRDEIGVKSTRPAKVTLLLQHIKKRGPKAYNGFKEELLKDYPWLVDFLEGRRQRITSGHIFQRKLENMHEDLVKIINELVIPLVYRMSDHNQAMLKSNDNPNDTLRKLSELLKSLSSKSMRALGLFEVSHVHTPLHIIISDYQRKMEHAKEEEIERKKLELNKKIDRQARKIKKLESDIESRLPKIKSKEKAFNEMKKEINKSKTEVTKLKRENAELKHQIHTTQSIGI